MILVCCYLQRYFTFLALFHIISDTDLWLVQYYTNLNSNQSGNFAAINKEASGRSVSQKVRNAANRKWDLDIWVGDFTRWTRGTASQVKRSLRPDSDPTGSGLTLLTWMMEINKEKWHSSETKVLHRHCNHISRYSYMNK